VFWNSGASDPVDAYSIDERVTLPLLPGNIVSSVTALDLDGDPEVELILLTPQGAYAVDHGGREFAEAVHLVGLPGGNAVAAGDFSRDGVIDLAIGGHEGLEVFPQRALNP
jgi:hypothetical protein